MLFARLLVAVVALSWAVDPAAAQPVENVQVSARIVSDYRLRGLSWSAGKPTLVLSGEAPVAVGTTLHATSFAARGAGRTGPSDVGVTLGMRHREYLGPVRAEAGASCRIFIPESAQTFCEVEAGASFDLAWANVYAEAAYAPGQASIGGDNLYVMAGASMAVPRSPVTLSAHIGHSGGTTHDAVRVMRLRPVSHYWDYGLGASLTKGRLTWTARYFGASGPSAFQTGGLLAEARIDF